MLGEGYLVLKVGGRTGSMRSGNFAFILTQSITFSGSGFVYTLPRDTLEASLFSELFGTF